MISKQLALGSVFLLGGSVALFALTQKSDDPANGVANTQKSAPAPQEEVSRPVVQPLTADLATERQFLEQKRQEREARALEQQRQNQLLFDEQEKAKNNALAKAQAEAKANTSTAQPISGASTQTQDNSTPATLTVQTRPEVIKAQEEAKRAEAQKEAQNQAKADDKPKETQNKNAPATTPKGHHLIKQGDTLLKVSRQYGVPVSVLASVNGMGRSDALTVGKTLKIPTKADIAKAGEKEKVTAQKEADKAEKAKADKAKADKEKAEKAKAKAEQAKKDEQKKSNKVPRHYSVQVGLLPKDKAQALASEYRKAGYKVQTSQTSRGVRVLVGSAKTESEANTLKNKIIKDSRVKTDGVWVKEVTEINAP